MRKKYSVFITALFCLFIFGFGVAHFVLPDKEFSEQENRYLAEMPTLDFGDPSLGPVKSGNFFNGKFMEDFEDYIIDQFPLRDQWIGLKALCERAVGKQENNGVYLGTDGQTLFAQFTVPTDEELEQKMGYVNQLADNLTVPVYFSLIPDKSYVWADRLPENAPNVDDGSMIADAKELCSDEVNFIDLRDALNGAETFYRTDHHWSTFGAAWGFAALSQAMLDGVSFAHEYDLTMVSDDFYGTTYSSAGANWIEPDSIYTYVSEDGPITVERYPSGTAEPGELYDESFLEKKDKYSMFLGGNQPLCVLRNENASTDQKVLVIRDSYSDCLAPFLALDYREVHLFDLRYNRTSVRQYVEENGIDQVLVLYSAANFATDSNLFLMSR